jgi:hypothetical protein
MGGVGKTRAAVEYAWEHAADYRALLFLSADSPGALERNLAALCGPLVLDLPEQGSRETAVQLVAVRRWLNQYPGWFLILDNGDTPEAQDAVAFGVEWKKIEKEVRREAEQHRYNGRFGPGLPLARVHAERLHEAEVIGDPLRQRPTRLSQGEHRAAGHRRADIHQHGRGAEGPDARD